MYSLVVAVLPGLVDGDRDFIKRAPDLSMRPLAVPAAADFFREAGVLLPSSCDLERGTNLFLPAELIRLFWKKK